MDLDAFSAVHEPAWRRLEQLSKTRRLTGAEADELVRLYQEVATHLSMVRSAAPDPSVVSRLSQVLARARAALSGAHDPAWREVLRFFVETLPAVLYRTRWWAIGTALACVVIAVVSGFYIAHSPQAQAAIGPPSALKQYADDAFASYYTEYRGSSFAAQVWTNNAMIAAVCVAFGITGLWPAYVLVQNAVAVGQAGAIMYLYGGLDVFFQLITPHGLLELTAIFVAGGAGLRLFWAMVDPHGRPRGRAVAEDGRALIVVAVGMVVALAISGLIEGFVTPSTVLPWWLKIVIGAIAFAGYWTYVWTLGRSAVRAGVTGDLRRGEGVDLVPLAA